MSSFDNEARTVRLFADNSFEQATNYALFYLVELVFYNDQSERCVCAGQQRGRHPLAGAQVQRAAPQILRLIHDIKKCGGGVFSLLFVKAIFCC
jgi:hypothetical protein